MEKIIHILGGGKNQIPLVELVKSMGYKALVTDMFPNPPCKQIADYFEQINTINKVNSLECALKYKVCAVVTDQTDVAVPTVAFIAEEMGLEGIGYQTALRFTNKFLLRDYLKDKHPDVLPQFKYFSEPQQAIKFCDNIKDISKHIIKPIYSQGSKGVFRLQNNKYHEQITATFNEANFSGVLLEEFIEGFEYSVEAYKQDNTVHNLAITKKYHYNSNDCIDIRNTYLGDVSKKLENLLFETNKLILETLKLPFGITHAEYKISRNGKPYLIEIAARGGGGSISSIIIPYLTNFNPTKALLSRLLKHKHHFKIDDYKRKYAILKFFDFKPGKIKDIYLNQDIANKALKFNLDIEIGDTIQKINDSRDRPGYFVIVGEDRNEILNLEREIDQSVQIKYE